jgi:peptide deformylase
MAQLKILQEPDPRLRQPTFAVQKVDGEITQHLRDMLETMYANDGIGLAAPQVNLRHRLVVMDVGSGPLQMVNPEIIWQSDTLSQTKEGCLSVPDYESRVTRCSGVRVRYWDECGQTHEEIFSGLQATCVQHEIDHLDGVLFIDHLSALQQGLVRRKLQKLAIKGYT